MPNPSPRHRELRAHDHALAWRFAASAPANAPGDDPPSLRLVRALAIAIACASLFFVLGLT